MRCQFVLFENLITLSLLIAAGCGAAPDPEESNGTIRQLATSN